MKRIKFLHFLIVIGAIPLGLALIMLFAKNSSSSRDSQLEILLPWLFIAPMPICIFLIKKVQGGMKNEFKDLVESMGGATHEYFLSWQGIAVNQKYKRIALYFNGVAISYDFNQVRNWTKRSQSGGLTYGGSAVDLAAGFSRLADNAKNTGLSVEVSDINHPAWMISMPKEQDRNRWFEIMQQSINEGKS
jgi:hypothetical protein